MTITALWIEKAAKKKKLAFFIQSRCAKEYRVAWGKYGHKLGRLTLKCEHIITGIFGCISGDWKTCRKHTLVCKHLTKKDDLKLNIPKFTSSQAGKAILEKWIRNKLGREAVLGQQFNKTTNRCESSHLTTFKSVPKCRTFKRNFTGRVHSATHSMTFGEMKSTLKLNALLGAKNIFLQSRLPLKKVEERQKARKKSIHYIRRRKRLRVLMKRLMDCKEKKNSYSPGCDDPVVRTDHSYQMP